MKHGFYVGSSGEAAQMISDRTVISICFTACVQDNVFQEAQTDYEHTYGTLLSLPRLLLGWSCMQEYFPEHQPPSQCTLRCENMQVWVLLCPACSGGLFLNKSRYDMGRRGP